MSYSYSLIPGLLAPFSTPGKVVIQGVIPGAIHIDDTYIEIHVKSITIHIDKIMNAVLAHASYHIEQIHVIGVT